MRNSNNEAEDITIQIGGMSYRHRRWTISPYKAVKRKAGTRRFCADAETDKGDKGDRLKMCESIMDEK